MSTCPDAFAVPAGRRRLLVGTVLALAAASSWSQMTYLCSVDGRTYHSVQPCPSPPAPVPPVGPAARETRPSGATPTRAPDKPAEPTQQQSPACAELSEAIRTGAARGLGPSGQQELREAYRRLCSEDARRALERLQNELGRQRAVREQEAKTAWLEQDRDKLTREQCAEMLRIAQGKRQRMDAMTAGERADFERFDATRRARCGG